MSTANAAAGSAPDEPADGAAQPPQQQQQPPQPPPPDQYQQALAASGYEHVTEWGLGFLTGIPAHIFGAFWVWVALMCLNDGRYHSEVWTIFAYAACPALSMWLAVFVFILEIFYGYRLVLVARNDRWQQPKRMRLRFMKAFTIVLDIVLILSLLTSTVGVAVDRAIRDHLYPEPQYWVGCAISGYLVIHYLVIVIGKMSKGRIKLHLAFEQERENHSAQNEAEPTFEPYRDAEEDETTSREAANAA